MCVLLPIIFRTMDIFGSIIGAGANLALGALQNEWTAGRTAIDRQQNYMYGEMAANNADRRTRALYNDLYSPQAQMRMLKEAGLSPSIYFGGTPGQGGMSGAQGNGATGIQTPYMPISLLEGAQLANIAAQTEKTKAETKNIDIDTKRQEIQKGVEQLAATQYSNEWEIMNSTWQTEDGKDTSIFEAAREHLTYDSFMEWCREGKDTNSEIKKAASTETGQRILRAIFMSANQFHRDIMVLSQDSVNADFQMSIVEAMKNTDFAKLNAQAAVQFLKTNIEAGKLSETQRSAWNNLIDRLGKKGSTTRDIVVVLGMILNQAMTNWHMPNVSVNRSANLTNYTINAGQ